MSEGFKEVYSFNVKDCCDHKDTNLYIVGQDGKSVMAICANCGAKVGGVRLFRMRLCNLFKRNAVLEVNEHLYSKTVLEDGSHNLVVTDELISVDGKCPCCGDVLSVEVVEDSVIENTEPVIETTIETTVDTAVETAVDTAVETTIEESAPKKHSKKLQ